MNAYINKQTKEQLAKLCNDYFLKHMTDVGKTNLIQMSLQPKDNMRPLHKICHTLPI